MMRHLENVNNKELEEKNEKTQEMLQESKKKEVKN